MPLILRDNSSPTNDITNTNILKVFYLHYFLTLTITHGVGKTGNEFPTMARGCNQLLLKTVLLAIAGLTSQEDKCGLPKSLGHPKSSSLRLGVHVISLTDSSSGEYLGSYDT